MNKRELLAKCVSASGLGSWLIRWQNGKRRLPVLAYHRVFDIGVEDDFPFDPELVSCSRDEFAWQMQFVARLFTPITFAQLIECRQGRAQLPNNPIIITFDDGHRDNFTQAFPILKRFGIPATIFLSTGYIGEGDRRKPGTFWFDRLCQLIYRAPVGTLAVQFEGVQFQLDDVTSRRLAAGRAQEILKRVSDRRRREIMAEAEEKLGQYGKSSDDELSAALTWNEVREMKTAGLEFGSHTVSHPILLQLDEGSLQRELNESKNKIESELGSETAVVAYPVGKAHAYDDRVIAASRSAGYRLGISYITGVNELDGLDEFAIRRLPVERYMSRDYFQMMLGLPARLVDRL